MLQFMGLHHQPLDWEDELQWCIQRFAGNDPCSAVKKITFNATIYQIWRERNGRLFELKRLVALDLIPKIIEDVRLRIYVLDLIVEYTTAPNRNFFNRWRLDIKFKHRVRTWHKPAIDWATVNSDGSLASPKGGYGALIRDHIHMGTVIAAAAGSQVGHSVILHEFQGVEMGINLARKYNQRKVNVCMDSGNAFTYITTNKTPPWEARHATRRMKMALGQFEDYSVRHVVRETNKAAVKLAKQLPNAEFIEVTPSSFAKDLKKIIFEDASEKKYMRI